VAESSVADHDHEDRHDDISIDGSDSEDDAQTTREADTALTCGICNHTVDDAARVTCLALCACVACSVAGVSSTNSYSVAESSVADHDHEDRHDDISIDGSEPHWPLESGGTSRDPHSGFHVQNALHPLVLSVHRHERMQSILDMKTRMRITRCPARFERPMRLRKLKL
jgi:hypothetical protein